MIETRIAETRYGVSKTTADLHVRSLQIDIFTTLSGRVRRCFPEVVHEVIRLA